MVQAKINSGIRVIWDGYGLSNPASGIYQYSKSVFDCIDTSNKPIILNELMELVPFSSCGSTPPVSRYVKNKIARSIAIKKGLYRLRDQLSQSAVVYHGLSNFNIPYAQAIEPRLHKRIVTIHDLIPFFKGATSVLNRLQMQYLVSKAVARADHIIAISEWTAATLRENFATHGDKIVVIPNGITLANKTPVQEVASDQQIKVLCVARYEKYKKLEKILEIAAHSSQLSVDLVTDSKGFSILSHNSLFKKGTVHLHVSLSQSQLGQLFESAHVYIHPSEWEGFCLPASQAMTEYLPIVYCSGSGIDELCGANSCIPLQPHHGWDDWIQAIKTAHNQRGTESFLSQRKLDLEAIPTWKQSTEKLVSLYNS